MAEKSRADHMALTRSIRTGGAGALVRSVMGTDVSSALPLAILKSMYLTLRSPNEPEEKQVINGEENENAKEQVDGEAPILKWVKVAVKPSEDPRAMSFAEGALNLEPSSKKWQARQASRTAYVMKDVLYDE